MKLRAHARKRQDGLSLVGFIFVIAIVALVAILALRVVPAVTEYAAIKRALVSAKAGASTPKEVQNAFDKQREATYIESVSGSDLEVVKTGDGFDVRVAYQKKIPLVGPASLVLDFVASSGSKPGQ